VERGLDEARLRPELVEHGGAGGAGGRGDVGNRHVVEATLGEQGSGGGEDALSLPSMMVRSGHV